MAKIAVLYLNKPAKVQYHFIVQHTCLLDIESDCNNFIIIKNARQG